MLQFGRKELSWVADAGQEHFRELLCEGTSEEQSEGGFGGCSCVHEGMSRLCGFVMEPLLCEQRWCWAPLAVKMSSFSC